MKLTVGDIRFSASGYASATVGVETGIFPFLLFSICKMDVSVPVVDGKEIKDYDEDLRNKAREIITKMYKEIVCGGEPGEASDLLNHLSAKTEPSEFSCKVKLAISDDATNKDLEERVALLEKRLSGKKTVHVNEKVVEFYNHDGTLAVRMGDLNQAENAPNKEALDSFLKRYSLAGEHFRIHPFKSFHDAIKHDVEGKPGIIDPIPVSFEIDANPISANLVPASAEVFRHERDYAEGTFTKIGPFYLKIQR